MNTRTSALLGAVSVSGLFLSGAGYQPKQPEMPQGHPQISPATPAAKAPEYIHVEADPKDVESIDTIIRAFYQSTSGLRGEPRQWDRFRSLFSKNARLIPVHYRAHEEKALFFIPVEEYIENTRKYLEKAGFAEKELSRRTEQFGSIAHAFSTYESKRNPDDSEAYSRGIYSFQLSHDGRRWYIVNVMWDSERPEQPLPQKYLSPNP